MKKIMLGTLVLATVAVSSYWVGYAHAQRGLEGVTLAQALESTALCANGLNTLAQDREQTTAKLLDHRLRSAVDTAERLSSAGVQLDGPIPNLVDGLRRAKQYADRIGDATLSSRLAALHEKLGGAGAKAGA
jgi:hypothetical protein